ncbi:MAG: hypothetical protein H0U80_03760 [Solirubrobacterales bacterium]|nr:hypothetical protein [Solirubrobacterales bacterium]
MRILRIVACPVVALAALFLSAGSALGYESRLEVKVETWTSADGRAYVGVQAAAEWAVPAAETSVADTTYYSRWELMGITQPYQRHYWVWVYRTADDERVNVTSPVTLFTSERQPGIGIRPEASGDLSLYLDVAVDPVSGPARSERTVSGELTAGWVDAVGGVISAYVIPDSVQVEGWTVDFGDGTVETFPPGASDPESLSVEHRYEAAGSFDAVVTARVSGEAYAAFFAPGGVPVERVIAWTLDITNSATGISALPIEYLLPVVEVGASPSGVLADGSLLAPPPDGLAALWWPRGLLCELFARATIVTEGSMRSGGITIGGSVTKLVAYRYLPGVNDASAPTAPGEYGPDDSIRIQWDTPLPGQGSYSVRLVLELETTYDDGTVRSSEVEGEVQVTVIYSAVGGG